MADTSFIARVTPTLAVAFAGWLAASTGLAAAGEAADDSRLQLPPREEIEKHKTYDSAPELQQMAGGGLIVNAFIMDGPVRVEIRDRHSGELLMKKQGDTLFPFQVSRQELGVQASQVVVRIFVKGEQAHELNLLPEP